MASVQSIDRAFDLLQALAVRPLLLTELAATVDLPVSTVSRLLATLNDLNAITRDEDGKYRIGELIAALAGGVDPTASLTTTAQPHLAALAGRIGESAGLSVSVSDKVLYISHVDVDTDVQIRQWTGASAPMHVVSAGLALMCHLPDETVDRILSRPLQRCTPVSVVETEAIRDRLDEAREVGYVWTGEEFVAGITSVASAVFDGTGVVAALHVHGPAYRFPGGNDAAAIGEAVHAAALDLSAALGA